MGPDSQRVLRPIAALVLVPDSFGFQFPSTTGTATTIDPVRGAGALEAPPSPAAFVVIVASCRGCVSSSNSITVMISKT